MKISKNAFTTAELMIALSLLILIVGLLIPVARKVMPDTDQKRLKHTYYSIISIVTSMINDPLIFLNSEFDNENIINGEKTMTFNNNKFTKIFKSKVNILEDNTSEGTSTVQTGYEETCFENNTTCSIGNTTRTTEYECFITNNNVKYCLPKITKEWDKYSYIVKVFLDPNLCDDKDAYFFRIDKTGKVYVLPTNLVTGITNPITGEDATCAKDDIYKTYKHCKTNDYLLDVK